MHRESVEKFVGEDTAGRDTCGDFDGRTALPFLDEMHEMLGELVASCGGTFDGYVRQSAEKIRELELREFEDVTGEAAGACGSFDEKEFTRAIELLPHFGELASEKTSENGMDVYAGVVIVEAAGLGLRIVAVDRVVKTFAHVFGKGDGAEPPDAFGEESGERGHAEAAPVGLSFRNVSRAD